MSEVPLYSYLDRAQRSTCKSWIDHLHHGERTMGVLPRVAKEFFVKLFSQIRNAAKGIEGGGCETDHSMGEIVRF